MMLKSLLSSASQLVTQLVEVEDKAKAEDQGKHSIITAAAAASPSAVDAAAATASAAAAAAAPFPVSPSVSQPAILGFSLTSLTLAKIQS